MTSEDKERLSTAITALVNLRAQMEIVGKAMLESAIAVRELIEDLNAPESEDNMDCPDDFDGDEDDEGYDDYEDYDGWYEDYEDYEGYEDDDEDDDSADQG